MPRLIRTLIGPPADGPPYSAHLNSAPTATLLGLWGAARHDEYMDQTTLLCLFLYLAS